MPEQIIAVNEGEVSAYTVAEVGIEGTRIMAQFLDAALGRDALLSFPFPAEGYEFKATTEIKVRYRAELVLIDKEEA